MAEPKVPHSAEVLTDWRDGWWHRDYLELVARRLDLASANVVLDVGCGKGHWSRSLGCFLRPDVELIGIDRAPEWVAEATRQARAAGRDHWRYLNARAEDIPLADESVDLVTCQTVLMHVPAPRAVLLEMWRVLRPGGRLVLAEPSNLAPSILRDAVTLDYGPERIARIAEFQATMVAGRIALGDGDECIGDRLPQLLRNLGAVDITAAQNDRMNTILAPHGQSEAERGMGPFIELVRTRGWRYDRDEAGRLYFAGGGTPERFEVLFAEWLEQADETVARLDAGTFWSTMGHNHYLISARKP